MRTENYLIALERIDGMLLQVIGAMKAEIVKRQRQNSDDHNGNQMQIAGVKMTKINIKGISVDHKIRKDGRFQARYTLDGVQHSVYGKTPDEALRKAIDGYKGKKRSKTQATTFEEWYKRWIQLYKVNKLRPNTLKNYNYTTNKYLIPKLGKIKINLLDTNTLQEVLNGIKLSRQQEIAGNILVACITKAYTTGLIKTNPALGVEKLKHNYSERRALTTEEIQRLLETIKGDRFELLIYVYLYAGLRRSEALALRWSDIDMQKKTITVRHQVNEQRQLTDTKSAKGNRTLPILPPLFDKLKEQEQNGNFLFTWRPSLITRELRKLFDNLNMPDIDVHCLRHTFATMLKDMGIPDDLRTKWMGHSKLEHKDRYEHIRDEYEIKQIELLQTKFDTKIDT